MSADYPLKEIELNRLTNEVLARLPQFRIIDKVTVISACMRVDGLPDFAVTEVEVSVDEYENGAHYDLTDRSLADRGFEEPYVHFDNREAPPFLHRGVREHLSLETNGNAVPPLR